MSGRPHRPVARVAVLAAAAALALTVGPAAAPSAQAKGKHRQARKLLPLRAAPVSTRTGDNVGAVRLTLRPVRRARLGTVRLALKGPGGAVLSRARVAHPNRPGAVVSLPLARELRAGRYTLRMVGRRARGGRRLSRQQPISFADGGGWAQPQALAGGALQKSVVDWYDGKWQGRDVAGFVVPGIGFGEIQCNPEAQWIRFFPAVGGREVAMMNWTYKDWGTYREKSLREAIFTRYTGPDFNEGLNKFGPAEDRSTGFFEGLISDRGPIGGPGGVSLAPPVGLHLSWQWDFSQPATSRCHVEAVFYVETAPPAPPVRSAQVVWRGEANAAGNSVATTDFPGLGAVTLTCEPGKPRRLSVDSPAGAKVTTREGSEDPSERLPQGPISVALPNNGMVLVEMNGGERILVSSRWKLNDPNPDLNWCLIAAQVVGAGIGT